MKQKRERDRNWTVYEKELLKSTIEPFLEIIDSKCNNMEMIEKKKEVWRRVASKLRLHGVEFQIPKLKQQWNRMKDQARLKIRGKHNVRYKKDSFVRSEETSLVSEAHLNEEANESVHLNDEVNETVHLNEKTNETYLKKENCVSETSDVDFGTIELEQAIQQPMSWGKLSLEEQISEKKLEKLNIEIAHENELFGIKKEIELKKLELIKLQIKKELEKF